MNRVRVTYAMMLILLGGALAACGTAQTSLDFSSYAHRVSDDTVTLYWNCSRPTPGVVQVQGVANNPFYPQPIQDLEIRVYGVNAQGANVSRARGSTQDYLIEMNSPSAFKIDLKTVGSEVRYDMIYSYMAGEGGRMALGGGGDGAAELRAGHLHRPGPVVGKSEIRNPKPEINSNVQNRGKFETAES